MLFAVAMTFIDHRLTTTFVGAGVPAGQAASLAEKAAASGGSGSSGAPSGVPAEMARKFGEAFRRTSR